MKYDKKIFYGLSRVFSTSILILFLLNSTIFANESIKKASDLDSIRVTLETKEIQLREAFQLLISKTKLQIIYNDDLIHNIKVKCSFNNVPLRCVIQTLLSQTDLTFKVMRDGQIVIIRKISEAKHRLSGAIKDAYSGEFLPYANVYVKNSENGTSSDINGCFTLLNLSAGVCTLKVNYMGHENFEFPVLVGNNDSTVTINLLPKILPGQEIIVTGERFRTVEVKKEASQYVLSPTQLSALPAVGEVDIFRSLQLLPGISRMTDISSGLNIRGGTADQNLILYDGITIYHVDHSFGFAAAFNSDAVQNVQIFKGGFPAKFGNRISSVVDLTGKSGNGNKFQLGGGLNLLNGTGLVQVPIQNRGSFLLVFRKSYNDFFQNDLYKTLYYTINGQNVTSRQMLLRRYPMESNSNRTNPLQPVTFTPDFFYYDFNGKLTYSVSQKDHFSVSFYRSQDHLNRSQNFYGVHLGEQPEADNIKIEDVTKWGNIGLSSIWSRKWNSVFNTRLLAAYSYYMSTTSQARNPDETEQNSFLIPYFSSEFNEIRNINFRLDNEWKINKTHTVEFGTDVSKIHDHWGGFSDDSIQILNQNKLASQPSFYIQDRWNPYRHLVLNFGLRSTFYDPLEQNYLEPRTSFQLTLSKNFLVKGGWGRYYQFINQVANENIFLSNRSFWLLADKNIRPSFAEHKILGFSLENYEFLFDVEVYYKTLDNVTVFNPPFQLPYNVTIDELYHVGNGVAKGLEILAQKKRGTLNGWISYTLGNVKYQIPQINHGDFFYANQDRTHEIKLVGSYCFGKWTLSAAWIYASGTPFTLPDFQYTLRLRDGSEKTFIYNAEMNANRLPAYHRLDASVTRSFVTGGLTWDLSASIFNLYNHLNVLNREYLFNIRPIIIRDVTTLGFTPTISLKVNWN